MESPDPSVRSLTGLPSAEELEELAALVEGKATESDIQCLFDKCPNLLAPVEMVDFVRHLRYPKRNAVNPSIPASKSQVRVPDFDGVHVRPFSTPVVIEMKGPGEEILDRSTGQLSAVALEVIEQLQTAMVHLLRPEGQALRKKLFPESLSQILDEDLLATFARIDSGSQGGWSAADLEALMRGLLDVGVAPIALIGTSREFGTNEGALVHARNEFLRRGTMLMAYDELLLMGQILRDYSLRNESLVQFFATERNVRVAGGNYVRFVDRLVLTPDALRELQLKLYRIMGDVCIYGLGNPPPPTTVAEGHAAFRVSDPFDVGMIWSPPTFLKGDERLLWAGRHAGSWLVVKERLSEPLLGGVVWYEFSPPTDVAPVIQT